MKRRRFWSLAGVAGVVAAVSLLVVPALGDGPAPGQARRSVHPRLVAIHESPSAARPGIRGPSRCQFASGLPNCPKLNAATQSFAAAGSIRNQMDTTQPVPE